MGVNSWQPNYSEVGDSILYSMDFYGLWLRMHQRSSSTHVRPMLEDSIGTEMTFHDISV